MVFYKCVRWLGCLRSYRYISWVLREEPYIEDIMAYFHRFITSSQRFYFGIASFTQIYILFFVFWFDPCHVSIH